MGAVVLKYIKKLHDTYSLGWVNFRKIKTARCNTHKVSLLALENTIKINFSIISKIQPSQSERKFGYALHNAKIVTLAKLAQIENSEPPVPPDSKNTQFVNFGLKLWKFMQ